MKKLILICGLLASGLSFGADWVFATSSKDGSSYYIDYDYYKYDKVLNTSDIWYKVEEISGGKSYTERKALTKYNCKYKEYKDLSIATYLPSGSTKDTYSSNYYSEYRTVFPDTVGEDLYNVACGTPSKGLDFKYPDLVNFKAYPEYVRAKYAYIRQKLPENQDYNPTKNTNIENYTDYSDYLNDLKKELSKIRLDNIAEQYKKAP
jgi:hypothetical protein